MELPFEWPFGQMETGLVGLFTATALALAWRRPLMLIGLVPIAAVGLLMSASLLDFTSAALLLAGINGILLALCVSGAFVRSAQLEKRLASAEAAIQNLQTAEDRRRAVTANSNIQPIAASPKTGARRAHSAR